MKRRNSPKTRLKTPPIIKTPSPTPHKSSSYLFSDTYQPYYPPIFILICLISYGISAFGDFVFDDTEAIVNNAIVQEHDLYGLWSADFWGRPIRDPRSHKSYRPLTTLTFILEHAIFGLSPLPYHLLNIFLHTIATLLVYSTSCQLSKKFNVPNVKFLASLLFSVHPVHSEAVGNLVGRAELLMTIFFLLCLQKWFQSVENSSFWHWLEFFTLGICSMLSKEQGIMLIPVCLALDAVLRLNDGKNELKNSKFLKRLLIGGIFLGSMAWTRLWINGFQNPKFSPMDNPAAFHLNTFYRILNYTYIWLYNLYLLAYPSQLCFDYSMGCIPLIESLLDYRLFIILSSIMGLFLTGFVTSKILSSQEIRFLTFSSSFMFLTFLPASNLLATVGFVVAERVLYLPSIGFCWVVAILVQKFERVNKNCTTMVCIILALMSAKCIERSQEWNDELKLYSSALSVCPNNAKVHYNIAKVLANRGNLSLAEEEYHNAINLNPSYEQALNNLALLFEKRSLYEKSEELLKSSLKIRPDFSTAWMNLGIIQMKMEKFEEAETSLYESLRRRPRHADTLFNIGNLYLKQERIVEAKNCWHNATSLDPKHLGAWTNLFILLEDQDECSLLESLASTAFEHRPDSSDLYSQFGLCLVKLGKFEKAEESLQKAVEISPENAILWGNLGTLYHRKEELEKAKMSYERSLWLDHKNLIVRENYLKLLGEMKKSV